MPFESSEVPAGTWISGAFEAAGFRLGTLISIGVPSIFSGGIVVVSGIVSAACASGTMTVAMRVRSVGVFMCG
ncbi:MAG: hypothetical protein ACK55I_46575, partial [bacterium]